MMAAVANGEIETVVVFAFSRYVDPSPTCSKA